MPRLWLCAVAAQMASLAMLSHAATTAPADSQVAISSDYEAITAYAAARENPSLRATIAEMDTLLMRSIRVRKDTPAGMRRDSTTTLNMLDCVGSVDCRQPGQLCDIPTVADTGVCICDRKNGYILDPSRVPEVYCLTELQLCVEDCPRRDPHAVCDTESDTPQCKCTGGYQLDTKTKKCISTSGSGSGSSGQASKPPKAPAPDSECAQICKKTYGPNAACGEKSGGNTASVQPSAGGKKAYKCACADATFWIPPSKGSEPVQCRKFTVDDCTSTCQQFFEGDVICDTDKPTPDNIPCTCRDPSMFVDEKTKTCVSM